MIQRAFLLFRVYSSHLLKVNGFVPALLVFHGAISALAFAPFHYQFLAVIGFSGFFYHLSHLTDTKTAFWRGWFFGAGFNVISFYWIGNSFTTVGLWYLAPLGSLCLPLLLAFFPAVVTALTVKISASKMGRFFAFCLFWSLSEWAKGWLFTGFPWTLVGYIWDLSVLQSTAWIGIYGVSAVTIFLISSLGLQRLSFAGISFVILACLWAGGQYRLSHYIRQDTGINIRLVQASIPQKDKWLIEHFEDNLKKWVLLSSIESERPLKAIIWSESSIPTFVADYPLIRQRLVEAVPSHGYLIFGAPRKAVEKESTLYYTSTFVLDERGEIIATTDKSHLVPFGEYIPFKNILKLSKLTAGSENYSPGKGLQNILLPGIPLFCPLICYEAIFSGEVIAPGPRPEWFLNQTNDAWFGESTGPHQHLEIARTRAIEEGIPVVRCANNGISAVIDPMGQILNRLELNDVGFIDFDLPKSLAISTFFSKYQNMGFWIIILVYGLFTLLLRNKRE